MAIKFGDAILFISGNKTKLNATLKDAENTTKSRMAKLKGHVTGAMRSLQMIGGAVGGALVANIMSVNKLGDQMAKAGKQLGMSAQEMLEFEFATKRSGASMNDFQAGMRRMARVIQEARDGQKEYVDTFDALNLDIAQLNAMNPAQAFMRMAEALKQIEDPMERAARAQEIFGRGGVKLLPLLNEGAAGIANLRDRAKELGLTLGDDAAAKAERFEDSLTDLKSALRGLQLALFGKADAAGFMDMMTENIISVRKWVDENERLISVLIKISGWLGALAFVLTGVKMAMMAIASTAAIVVGAITAIILSIKSIIGTLKRFKATWKDVLGGMVEYVKTAIRWWDKLLSKISIPGYTDALASVSLSADPSGYGQYQGYAAPQSASPPSQTDAAPQPQPQITINAGQTPIKQVMRETKNYLDAGMKPRLEYGY